MLSQPRDLISYLRVMVGAWRDDPRDDAELVARYAETRNETAFAALMWRHEHSCGERADVSSATRRTSKMSYRPRFSL